MQFFKRKINNNYLFNVNSSIDIFFKEKKSVIKFFCIVIIVFNGLNIFSLRANAYSCSINFCCKLRSWNDLYNYIVTVK